jgi:hypothetical protein
VPRKVRVNTASKEEKTVQKRAKVVLDSLPENFTTVSIVTISGQPKGITKRRYQCQTPEQIKNTTRAVIANLERLLFLRA